MLARLKLDFEGEEYSLRLESRIRDEGYATLGISGGMTTLMAAMLTGRTSIVSMLLESGANVDNVDVMGNDALMLASVSGRSKNLQCWLERVKDWDLNRKNTVIGGCALGHAVHMGANKLETVKVLLDAGVSLGYRTFNGGNVLIDAAANEDSDPEVVRLSLKTKMSSCNAEAFAVMLNYKKISTTMKWKCINSVAKVLYRTGASKAGLMNFLALDSGTSALNHAVCRGDVEIVKILLEYGADPYVENDLGVNAFGICDEAGPFRSVRKKLEEQDAKIET